MADKMAIWHIKNVRFSCPIGF